MQILNRINSCLQFSRLLFVFSFHTLHNPYVPAAPQSIKQGDDGKHLAIRSMEIIHESSSKENLDEIRALTDKALDSFDLPNLHGNMIGAWSSTEEAKNTYYIFSISTHASIYHHLFLRSHLVLCRQMTHSSNVDGLCQDHKWADNFSGYFSQSFEPFTALKNMCSYGSIDIIRFVSDQIQWLWVENFSALYHIIARHFNHNYQIRPGN